MKQSTYRKELTVTGPYGTANAVIIVTMNHMKDQITQSYNSGVDVTYKWLHKIEVFVNGEFWKGVKDLTTEEDVFIKTKVWLYETTNHIKQLANTPPIKSFDDKMKELFA